MVFPSDPRPSCQGGVLPGGYDRRCCIRKAVEMLDLAIIYGVRSDDLKNSPATLIFSLPVRYPVFLRL